MTNSIETPSGPNKKERLTPTMREVLPHIGTNKDRKDKELGAAITTKPQRKHFNIGDHGPEG